MRTGALAALLVLALPGALLAGPADPSIGACTRKEEFLKRQEALDAKVQALTGAKDDAARMKAVVAVEHRIPGGRFVTAAYGHCAFDVCVKQGQVVKAGQKIATQGLSCANENGGYGSHLHFGLGDGPFRRPAGLARGDQVDMDLGGGKKVKVPVLRLAYSKEKRNQYGWPLTAFVVKNPDGSERTVDVPEQQPQQELGWFQAYVKGCRGWLDPQKTLPEWVEPKGK